MINRKYMNYIKKEIKKDNELIISYQPTAEEKEYLEKYNIKYEIVDCTRLSPVADRFYKTKLCHYYIEK